MRLERILFLRKLFQILASTYPSTIWDKSSSRRISTCHSIDSRVVRKEEGVFTIAWQSSHVASEVAKARARYAWRTIKNFMMNESRLGLRKLLTLFYAAPNHFIYCSLSFCTLSMSTKSTIDMCLKATFNLSIYLSGF